MTPEEHNILKRVLELSEENSRILEKLNSERKWRRFFSLLYWVVIIGVAVGAYYFVEPIVTQFLQIYEQFGGSNGFKQFLPGQF